MTEILVHKPGIHDIGPAAVAIGVFDGVHLGHQALVSDTIALAQRRGTSSCVLTFDRDPDQVVSPDHAAPQLTTLDDKLALLSGLYPDVILVVPFDPVVAAMTPDEFVTGVLKDASDPVACVVGYDFRFGARASGDANTLRELGQTHGFDVVTHPLIHIARKPITSTRIRGLVSTGQVAEARLLLGRPHRLRGTVVAGRGVGRELGAPTANIDVDAAFALPAPGVYSGRAQVSGAAYAAAISVGPAPSFPGATCRLEAHLLDFSGDIYGQPIMVEFVEHLRAQRAFSSETELAAAIAADIAYIAGLHLADI